MSEKIIIEAENVWDYFEESEEQLSSGVMEKIASNNDYGVEIFLTGDEDGYPIVVVIVDDEVVEEEYILNKEDCYDTVSKYYDTYLSHSAIDFLSGEHDSFDEDISDELDKIDEREGELDEAIYTCLDVFVPNLLDISRDPDSVYEDIKDHLCEYLYRKYGVSVYRPMYLECEDGSDEFFEFPYSEMEFDDE